MIQTPNGPRIGHTMYLPGESLPVLCICAVGTDHVGPFILVVTEG